MTQPPPLPPPLPSSLPSGVPPPPKKPSELKQILVGGLAFIGICFGLLVLALGYAAITRGAQPARAAAPAPAHAPSATPPAPPASDPATDAIVADVVRLNDPETMGRAILDWRAMSPDVPYAALERGADAYRGQRVVFRGRVAEIHDTANGGSSMRIATRGRYDKIYWVESYTRPSPSVVAGSSVVVVGRHAGAFTYQSQAGWTITLPAALALAVLPASEASAAERAASRALP